MILLKIDKAILDTSEFICENISKFGSIERGLLSQNILGHIRNFVEYIAVKIYFDRQDVEPNYEQICKALKNLEYHGELRFLNNFHRMLQKSVSHYTINKDGSERLMLKYYEYLLEIKCYLKQKYNLDVLENLDKFPLNTNTELSEYYEKIAEKIELQNISSNVVAYNERYYVQKVKPFFVNKKIYYEVTFTTVMDNISKSNRVIAFTHCKIMDNYAVTFSIHYDTIHIINKDMSILIIDNYQVSIRPCEFDNLSKIIGLPMNCSAKSIEYKKLMTFLKLNQMSLTELVSAKQNYYETIKAKIIEQTKSIKIYDILDKCRKIIMSNSHGANILRYLLYKMTNHILKCQYFNKACKELSNLYLSYKCIPFDHMPYCTSLCQHNPKIYDLLDSIPLFNREHELFARYIQNNTEIEGKLFTSKKEINGFENIDELILKYNESLYFKHSRRKLEEYKGNIYIREYVEDSSEIIKQLQHLSSSGVFQYTASVDSWLSLDSYSIDDNDKKEILRLMFQNSHVAIIYGSAGTGKSTLINHIANFWKNKNKIFLANTHPAVDNLRRRVTANNSEYSTIAKFLSSKNLQTDCDILFIDECSTISNRDMCHILKKANFKLLVLVGDVYQIESIYFGNWFSISPYFLPNTSVFELKHPYRTANQDLLTVWNRVRSLDDSILELLVKKDYVSDLDESILEHSSDDEIILCLNYDGLYGINNINHFLQDSNPNKGILWGLNTYKVGDPILFNESNAFSPLIYNNAKGKIIGILPSKDKITFEIELEKSINELDAEDYNFELINESTIGHSVISFSINKSKSTDEDDENNSTIVPFQVAYAVSIHKAQGLEYDSVKIIITSEIEERITHNIFYTAITRTKNKLKIYWKPEVENKILNNFKIKTPKKDAYLLSHLMSITMVKNSLVSKG